MIFFHCLMVHNPGCTPLSLRVVPHVDASVLHLLQVEEDIDVALARACVADPSQFIGSDCKLIQQIIREYKCEIFLCLGGFRNVRNVYDWEGVKLELDETHYAFGTTYEIECETNDPERFRQLLGELLDKNGITYRYSTISKFGIFRSGKIDALH